MKHIMVMDALDESNDKELMEEFIQVEGVTDAFNNDELLISESRDIA
jgi:hypothetical protein